MERDSFLYKSRRKGQVLAHKLLPDAFMSKLYFKIVLKKELNLDNPQTFNEKIQWCKLNYLPKIRQLCNVLINMQLENTLKKRAIKTP